jgi:hypothetical protein
MNSIYGDDAQFAGALAGFKVKLDGMPEPQKADKLREIRAFIEEDRQASERRRCADLPGEIERLAACAHTLEAELSECRVELALRKAELAALLNSKEAA